MDWVKIRTNIADHHRLLEAGALARDLWTWGMLYAGKHESDGELPMAAVMASPWGHGGKANVKLAARLVEVGLWERTDSGFRICRWSEQGNQTKAQIDSERAAARARKARRGSPEVRANSGRRHAEVPTSYSLSPSGSGSDLGSQSTADATGDTPPPWFAEAAETVAMALGGEVTDIPARWLEYRGARTRKGWAKGREDAVSWLSTVVRSERDRAARSARAGPAGRHHVQSSEDRAWELPPELR